MGISHTRGIIFIAALLSLLSIISLYVNLFVYHYPGNNYFPPSTLVILFMLILMYAGFSLQYGNTNQLTKKMKEVVCFFLVMAVLALATNAAQYTPFPTIDKHIVAFEASLHIDIKTIISWTQTKPMLQKLLGFIYDSLPYQMVYFPLIIIATRRLQYIREYYFLMLASALIGFTFYYFFPTTAPASIFTTLHFNEEQRATGLKFLQLHQHIQPTTLEGGMIALPSFHAIWAWFCLYLIRGWPVAFVIMLPVNSLLVASCVLLGWHYPMDIFGAIIVVFMSHGLYYFCKKGL